jgi:hypothetical protein
MRYILAVFTMLVACSVGAADAPEQSPERNGSWLQRGIKEYARFNAHDNGQSLEEVSAAVAVTYYIAGIVDFENSLTLRADLIGGVIGEARKEHAMSEQKLSGMADAARSLAPLMTTHFFEGNPPADRVVLIVRDYLSKHPEALSKRADMVVESALLDAYPRPVKAAP